jgi:dipeptidyl-peptidase-4
MSRLLPLLLLIAVAAAAQKKPVTLDAVVGSGRPASAAGSPVWAPDGKSFVYQQGGKVWLYEMAAKKARELFSLDELTKSAIKPPPRERFDWENRRVREETIQWAESGKELLVLTGGDIFLWRLAAAKHEQLTATPVEERDPKLSPDGTRVLFRRTHDIYVLDIAAKKETRLTRDGSETLLNGELDWVYPEELDLGTAYWWSPDGKWIAFLQFDVSREPIYPHVDLRKYRALLEPQRYPQAGENNADVRVGVMPAAGGPIRWMDTGDTRERYLIARVAWMPDNRCVLIQRLTRVQNQLDLLAADINTGVPKLVLRETDPFWVNLDDNPRFLKDGRRFLWTSERDGGFRHIFLCSSDGSEQKQLTKGEWEVRDIVGVDEAASRVFYQSSEPSPIETHLYSVKLDGSDKRRITQEPGTHSISMPETAEYFLDTYSSLQSPSRRVLRRADGSEYAVYREADRGPLNDYEILPTEIVKLKAADGKTDLYARLIKPAGFRAGRKYPAIVMVYGGPHAQSVRNSWSGLTWDQALAHKGFVIWQVDNRGSAGRGHLFEAPLFRKMGQVELEDQRAGVAHLISMGFVDPARVGIYGWSYGGFMAANALLNAGDVFRAGVSGAPVTNFANYDSIYTERYMGLPQENPDGYAGTNLSLKAGNLKGKLMLVHNIDDDNVLFQNMLQLTDALQRAGKQFDFMLYPQKSHGVTGPVRKQMLEGMTAFFERALAN